MRNEGSIPDFCFMDSSPSVQNDDEERRLLRKEPTDLPRDDYDEDFSPSFLDDDKV